MTYSEIDRTEWGKLVRESETGTWFQSPEAYAFFASMPELFEVFVIGIEGPTSDYSMAGVTFHTTPSVLSAKSQHFSTLKGREGLQVTGDGLRAVCVGYVTKEKGGIRQFFTRRAIVNGGVCCANDATNEEIETLLAAVREHLADKAIYIETRNFNDYSRWREAFEKTGFEYKKHLNFHVDCRDEEKMRERLSDNRKRQIKKGGDAPCYGLRETGDGLWEEEIRAWYGILEELYRTKVKTPLWPVEFFIEAYRQGVGQFLLVKHEGKVIGGSMVVCEKGPEDGTVYEWFECGKNSEYKEQYPSVTATWAGMRWAHAHGCTRYDMMGAGEPGVPYGVRDFKSEFGGTMVEHGRFVCVTKPLLYRIGVWGVKRMKSK